MNGKALAAMTVAVGLAGCASAPLVNPALENARAAVQSAEADPNVAKYDPLDLQAAKNYLATADGAAQARHEAEIGQPAYLAAQTAKLAQARAAAKADDARVAAGQQERDQIQLAARAREARNAEMAKQAADAQAQAANANAQAANAQTAQLQAELTQMKAAQTDRGLVLTLGDVLFETGKAALNSGAARKLDQLAQFLTEHKDRRVEIDGFTDSVGSDSFNTELSEERAASVKSALIGRGIDPSRISTRGFGKAFPVASNSEASGRQLNRRVEVVIGNANNSDIAPRTGS